MGAAAGAAAGAIIISDMGAAVASGPGAGAAIASGLMDIIIAGAPASWLRAEPSRAARTRHRMTRKLLDCWWSAISLAPWGVRSCTARRLDQQELQSRSCCIAISLPNVYRMPAQAIMTSWTGVPCQAVAPNTLAVHHAIGATRCRHYKALSGPGCSLSVLDKSVSSYYTSYCRHCEAEYPRQYRR